MTDPTQALKELREASRAYEEADAARNRAHEVVIARALDALRAGVQPGEVYGSVPFTSTHIRTLARDAGIPGGRPGKPKRTPVMPKPGRKAE
jgi:hypothetical protein